MQKGPLAGPMVDETAPFMYFQRQVSFSGWGANSSSLAAVRQLPQNPRGMYLCLEQTLQVCLALVPGLQACGSAIAATHAMQ